MATYEGQIPTAPAHLAGRDPARGVLLATSTIRYRFLRLDGTRDWATSLAAIPAGAVIERTEGA